MQLPKHIQCKRVYDSTARNDGFRALVDRVWPRGISKSDLAADGWYRDLAPSSELRKWFGHDPQRWAAFYQKYHVELRERQAELAQLLEDCDGRTLTLLYAAKDTEHNNAVALKMYLQKHGQN